jgi:hypothetical protein
MRLFFDASDLVDDAIFENNPVLKENITFLAQEIAKSIDEKIKNDLKIFLFLIHLKTYLKKCICIQLIIM